MYYASWDNECSWSCWTSQDLLAILRATLQEAVHQQEARYHEGPNEGHKLVEHGHVDLFEAWMHESTISSVMIIAKPRSIKLSLWSLINDYLMSPKSHLAAKCQKMPKRQLNFELPYFDALKVISRLRLSKEPIHFQSLSCIKIIISHVYQLTGNVHLQITLEKHQLILNCCDCMMSCSSTYIIFSA